jgi:hypothetical protein
MPRRATSALPAGLAETERFNRCVERGRSTGGSREDLPIDLPHRLPAAAGAHNPLKDRVQCSPATASAEAIAALDAGIAAHSSRMRLYSCSVSGAGLTLRTIDSISQHRRYAASASAFSPR